MTPGYYGKLPSRGDFVGHGLSATLVAAWDDWIGTRLRDSRAAFGADWTALWLVAPVWHFALPPGQCGPQPASGLMLPSVDKVGRYFPLMLAVEAAADPPTHLLLERHARDALEQDWTPDRLAATLATMPPPPPPPPPAASPPPATAAWWTEGGPHVSPTRIEADSLPDTAAFQAMLRA